MEIMVNKVSLNKGMCGVYQDNFDWQVDVVQLEFKKSLFKKRKEKHQNLTILAFLDFSLKGFKKIKL